MFLALGVHFSTLGRRESLQNWKRGPNDQMHGYARLTYLYTHVLDCSS